MRRAAALLGLLMLVSPAVTVVAQIEEDEDGQRVYRLPGSGERAPLYLVEGDVFILDDEAWCENLLALASDTDGDGDIEPAAPAEVAACAAFLRRLAANEVTLLPLSLAEQLVALPDALLVPDPTVAPPAVDAPVVVSGTGEGRSETFELGGGRYAASAETSERCEFFAAFLTDADAGVIVDRPGALLDGTEPAPSIESLPPGEYLWDVLAESCAWTITLVAEPPLS